MSKASQIEQKYWQEIKAAGKGRYVRRGMLASLVQRSYCLILPGGAGSCIFALPENRFPDLADHAANLSAGWVLNYALAMAGPAKEIFPRSHSKWPEPGNLSEIAYVAVIMPNLILA